MKITVNIKNSKVGFFVELLRNLDFVTIESAQDIEGIELSKEHKNILDQRLKDYQNNPDDVIKWEDFKEEMNKNLK